LWKQGGGVESDLTEEIKRASNEEIQNRTKLLDNETKVRLFVFSLFLSCVSRLQWFCMGFEQIMKGELSRIVHEQNNLKERIKENQEKVKVNKQLPYLVANIVEVCSCSCSCSPLSL
jgi:26S proteasome regulatory subunit T5